MESLFVFILIAMIGIFVAATVLDRQARLKRIEAMRALAARLGYEYGENAGMNGMLDGFGLLSQGHSHRTANLLRTEVDGATITVFDWHYATGSGKSRHVYDQSVLLFSSPRLNLPTFSLRPEGLGSKLLGMLGQQDIDFEEHPLFSELYCLQGSDESRIRALFDANKLSFFEQWTGMCVYGRGRELLCYRKDRAARPHQIPNLIESESALFRLFAAAAPAARPALPAGLESVPTTPPVPVPDAVAEEEPDPLAGLDELLAEMGVDEGPVPS